MFFKNICETEDIEHALPINSRYDANSTHQPLKVISTWPMLIDFSTENLNWLKFL